MSIGIMTKYGLKKIAPKKLNSETSIGTFLEFAGDVAPEGYLYCDGSEVAIAKYPELYAKIGNLYGTPSSNLVFKLPDCRGRSIRGALAGNAGRIGGQETVALTDSQLPWHAHELNPAGKHSHTLKETGEHKHSCEYINCGSLTGSGKDSFKRYDDSSGDVRLTVDDGAHKHLVKIGGGHMHTVIEKGENKPFSIMQPFATIKIFIKAKIVINTSSTTILEDTIPDGTIVENNINKSPLSWNWGDNIKQLYWNPIETTFIDANNTVSYSLSSHGTVSINFINATMEKINELSIPEIIQPDNKVYSVVNNFTTLKTGLITIDDKIHISTDVGSINTTISYNITNHADRAIYKLIKMN